MGEERNLNTQSAVLHGFCVRVTQHPRGTTLVSGNSAVPAMVGQTSGSGCCRWCNWNMT